MFCRVAVAVLSEFVQGGFIAVAVAGGHGRVDVGGRAVRLARNHRPAQGNVQALVLGDLGVGSRGSLIDV